ncbi:MAG: flavodoxin family protein [candidate division WOR-3 bacterium]
MTQVLFLEGSPRHGNTEQVTDWVIAGMGRKAKVHRVRLIEKQIHECQECFGCTGARNRAGCHLSDDMAEIYDLILGSDLTAFTSPVFCWGVSGITKLCIDRCFALLNGENLLKGSKLAVVLTAGGDHFDGADLAVAMFERLAKFGGIELVGRYVVADCPSGRSLRNNRLIEKQSREFGRRLLQALNG